MKIERDEKNKKIKRILEYLAENGHIYSKRAMERRFGIDYKNYRDELEKFIQITPKRNERGKARHKITLKRKYKKIILSYLKIGKWNTLQIYKLYLL